MQDSRGAPKLVSNRAWPQSAGADVLTPNHSPIPGEGVKCSGSRVTPLQVTGSAPQICQDPRSLSTAVLTTRTLGPSLCRKHTKLVSHPPALFCDPGHGPHLSGPVFSRIRQACRSHCKCAVSCCVYPRFLSSLSTPVGAPHPHPHPRDRSHRLPRPGSQRRAPATGQNICLKHTLPRAGPGSASREFKQTEPAGTKRAVGCEGCASRSRAQVS